MGKCGTGNSCFRVLIVQQNKSCGKGEKKGNKMEREKKEKQAEEKQKEQKQVEQNQAKQNQEQKTKSAASFGEKTKSLSKTKKIVIGVVAVLLVIYVIGVLFFHWHFQLNTTLNGHKVDFKNGSDVKAELTKTLSDHDLILVERNDKKEVIKMSDIDASLEYNNGVYNTLRKQNEFLWFINCFRKKNLTLEADISYDADKLEEIESNLTCLDKKNDIDVENAKVEYKDGAFQIVPEVLGTEVVKKELHKQIVQALKEDKRELNLEEAGCYKEPTIYSTDKKATDALITAQKYAGSKITYRFARETEVVNAKKINEWITFDDELNVGVSKKKVGEYIAKLADEYDTNGKSIKLKSTNQGTVTVPGGTYGWTIDQDKETERLIQLIKQGRSVEKEPSYSKRGENGIRTSVSSNPKTYIEVSISEQHMWFYKNGKRIVDTPVVTGDIVRAGRRTHTGAYYIFYKQSPAVLKGANYASPVTFWMPFHNGEGIHDASWRGAFGGSIYMGGGSHGCVNTPYSQVREIYHNAEVGTPVFVY